ncbi:hypothetical protein BRARA_I00113 [Brassica rapa]|uniref:Uncharacterized protein n=1 Tax=Brassica campestris TaxID=3711 RepID=A0A397XPW3_BRACM|nr:hypothetical protein BRARA_I00113 [Brassica rapa]
MPHMTVNKSTVRVISIIFARQINHSDSTRAPSLLRTVATHSTIYHIWRQRNNLLHNHIHIPAITVFRLINRNIRNTLLGRRSKKKFMPLMSKWLM